MKTLNSGKGVCEGSYSLLIKPVQSVVELGAAQDVTDGTLKAVHQKNRNGSSSDFIAVSFPSMHMGRSVMLSGFRIELIGSKLALEELFFSEAIALLKRRNMLEQHSVSEVNYEPGEVCAAYIRDRSCEKHTEGWIRRSKARALRRGKSYGKDVKLKADATNVLFLKIGNSALHIREIVGEYQGTPLIVNTYGFSTSQTPAFLPVMPLSARA